MMRAWVMVLLVAWASIGTAAPRVVISDAGPRRAEVAALKKTPNWTGLTNEFAVVEAAMVNYGKDRTTATTDIGLVLDAQTKKALQSLLKVSEDLAAAIQAMRGYDQKSAAVVKGGVEATSATGNAAGKTP